jgi:hypothetical protein
VGLVCDSGEPLRETLPLDHRAVEFHVSLNVMILWRADPTLGSASGPAV